ncbi:MAG: hypothetical protein J6U13_00455 [Salinivirgaceae bacterium]|nr:hypothetical protein [Salinivirgaceae bacterium]
MKNLRINEERANVQNENNNFLNNKTFRIVRADESVLEKENDVETFVAAIKEAGIERVMGLNLQFGGEPLISANISTKHKQTEIGNGLYVMLHSSGYMQNILQNISKELNLNWFATELDFEIIEDVMPNYERGMKTLVLVVDKETLTAIVTGHKKVFELELLPENAHQLVEHDDENYIVEGDEQKGEAVVTKKYDAIRFYTDHNRNSDSALVKIEKTISMYMRDGNGNVMFEGDPNNGKDYWPYIMIEYHLGEILEKDDNTFCGGKAIINILRHDL